MIPPSVLSLFLPPPKVDLEESPELEVVLDRVVELRDGLLERIPVQVAELLGVDQGDDGRAYLEAVRNAALEELGRRRGPDAPERVVLRVLPEHRDDRGRYWRPYGWGYTDQIEEAGTWSPQGVPRSDRADAVPVSRAADEHGEAT